MIESLRRVGDGRENMLGTTAVYVESKSQVRALGRKLETKGLK